VLLDGRISARRRARPSFGSALPSRFFRRTLCFSGSVSGAHAQCFCGTGRSPTEGIGEAPRWLIIQNNTLIPKEFLALCVRCFENSVDRLSVRKQVQVSNSPTITSPILAIAANRSTVAKRPLPRRYCGATAVRLQTMVCAQRSP